MDLPEFLVRFHLPFYLSGTLLSISHLQLFACFMYPTSEKNGSHFIPEYSVILKVIIVMDVCVSLKYTV